MERLSFNKTFEVGTAYNSHQTMMDLIKKAGWGEDKRYLGMWGRIIKKNTISPDILTSLIKKAQGLEQEKGYSARGLVRKWLQNNTWRSQL